MRAKPNFKTIDLAAPLWVPKVGEMCEVQVDGKWLRCKVLRFISLGEKTHEVETEMPHGLQVGWAGKQNLRESTTVPASKLDQLAVLMKQGKWPDALKFAAKFKDLGAQAKAITQGAQALTNPGFYEQIKKDPAALVAAGIEALKERYVKN